MSSKNCARATFFCEVSVARAGWRKFRHVPGAGLSKPQISFLISSKFIPEGAKNTDTTESGE